MPIGKVDPVNTATQMADRIVIEAQANAVPYVDAKSKRILVQGLTQAVLQSPGLAGLPYANEEQYVALVKSVTDKLIAYVEGK